MKWLVILVLIFSLVMVCYAIDHEDNDFAEFEDFDSEDEEFIVEKLEPNNKEKNRVHYDKEDDFGELDNDVGEMVVEEEDEDNEFEHFQDEEEFTGFPGNKEQPSEPEKKSDEPKLTMAKVPLHFRTHWDSYWMEMIMIAGLFAYFSNYFVGRGKNIKLANIWLSSHKSLLEDNFVLVGDDGKLENESQGLMKESESLYTLWCSGRTCCEGMLIELRMIKRQDLISIIAGMMKSTIDQVHIKVELSKDSSDTFVFCVGTKKIVSKMFKDLSDLVRR